MGLHGVQSDGRALFIGQQGEPTGKMRCQTFGLNPPATIAPKQGPLTQD